MSREEINLSLCNFDSWPFSKDYFKKYTMITNPKNNDSGHFGIENKMISGFIFHTKITCNIDNH